MKIIVFVKQVPDTASDIIIQKDGKSIVESDISWVMNPYDEFAVEEALSIKEEIGAEVTVVSFGPQRAQTVIRTAIAMGADKGVFVTDDNFDELDSFAIAKLLAETAKNLEFDLIFTGQRGVDDDQGVVGATIAELLDIPQVSLAIKVEVADDQKSVTVHRYADGRTEIVKASAPALITAEKGLNEPRYATMRRIMMAKKKKIATVTAGDLGIDPEELKQRKMEIIELTLPPKRSAGMIIDEGSPEANAAKLVELLHSKAKVI